MRKISIKNLESIQGGVSGASCFGWSLLSVWNPLVGLAFYTSGDAAKCWNS